MVRAAIALVLLAGLGVAVACGGRSDLLPGEAALDHGGNSSGGRSSAGNSGTAGARPFGGTGTSGSGGFAPAGNAGSPPFDCPPGATSCQDTCVDLKSDRNHCGSCTQQCPRDELCDRGTCACGAHELELLARIPENGSPNADPADTTRAFFNCSVDRRSLTAASARLSGNYLGPIPITFPKPERVNEVVLDPNERAGHKRPYFAGERVTAWLGAKLGTPEQPFRPYLWQFTIAVGLSSPGVFRAGTQDLSALGKARVMALGDLDSDGDLDAIVRGDTSLVLLRNHGDATFDAPEALSGNGAPALGDVDGDGDLDVANGEQLLLNDGKGHLAGGPAAAGCVAFGDVDGDGDLDCLASVGTAAHDELLGHVLFNTGNGNMQAGPQTPFGFDCQLADLDNDGDLDAVCVPPVVTGASAFLNDGHGTFTRTAQLLGEAGARGIALGDVDADGDIDLVVSQWFGGGKSSPNLLYLNDGSGNFTAGNPIGSDGGDIALADLDGDGDFDAVFSHLTPYGPVQGPFNPAAIFVNDGRGHFKQSQGTLGNPAFHWFEFGDLDADGDLDAFVFHQVGVNDNYSAVWLNQN